ncbi:MAG: DUF7088 domain-containing protein, partial [Luteolibacter sp.]
MSEPMPDRQRPSRPNRLGAGLFCLIQSALILVILLSANYLSLSHHRAFDLTRAGDYSLAPATQNYLAANSLQSREKKIRWIMAYRRSAPLYERVRAVAEEYARRSGGKIELEVVDPLRSPDRMEEIISAYGITLVRDLIIIDARLDDRAATREDENRVRTLHANVRLVPADDMLVYTTTQGVRRVSGFKGE